MRKINHNFEPLLNIFSKFFNFVLLKIEILNGNKNNVKAHPRHVGL